MGISDRDYIRDNSRPFFGSLGERAQVTLVLLIGSVAVFLLQLLTRRDLGGGIRIEGGLAQALVLSPEALRNGEFWRLVTFIFVHSTETVWPILGNMLLLWFCGSAIEDLEGSREFLVFFLTTTVLVGGGQVLLSSASQGKFVFWGMSGPVTALLLTYACRFPDRTFLLFVIPVSIWVIVALQIGQDLAGLAFAKRAWPFFVANLLGGGIGLLYQYSGVRLTNLKALITGSKGRSRTHRVPQLRIYHPEVAPTPSGALQPTATPRLRVNESEEDLEAQLDRVLEKVAKHGQESLTDGERAILFRASEIFRNRRKS